MADADDAARPRRLPAPPPGATRRQVLLFAAASALVGSAALHPDSAFAATSGNLDDLDESKPEGTPNARARAAAVAGPWGGYSNGQIPVEVLTQVPVSVGQPYLRSDAATAWGDLNIQFTNQFGTALVITEAYRDLARQQALYDDYIAGTGNLAAEPGTSIHGWALAADFGSSVDVGGSPQKLWMDANAPAFGWQPTGNTFSQVEPWHFEYDGSYQPEEPAPPAALPEESDMKIISNNGREWLLGEFTAVEINTSFLNELKSEYGISGTLGSLRAALHAQYGDPIAIQMSGNVDSLIAVAKKNRAGLISDLGS